MLIAASTPSNPIVALLVGGLLFLAGRPIIKRTADSEGGNAWLVKVMTASLVLHLLAAPGQIFVVDHFYHGIADWIRYDTQGGILAPEFRHFDFSTANANLRGIVNDGSVSIAAGIVMAIVGNNQLASFFVFAWLSFLGTTYFYRAFRITFPQCAEAQRRYALMIFFLPSIIFWTADVSKEAIMISSLGIITLGTAKVLKRQRGGFVLIVIGASVGFLIRPNELVVIMAAFSVALFMRPGEKRAGSGLKRVGGLLLMSAILVASVVFTIKYLFHGGSVSLSSTATDNSGTGAGFGSSGVPHSTNPLLIWENAYSILFDPLPINAVGTGEYVASLENMVIIGLFIWSWRNFRISIRAAFAQPYIMMCLVYCVGFIYAFASLDNLGLIARERTLLFPYLLVLLCIPRTPKGKIPEYDWEYKRKMRKLRKQNPQMVTDVIARNRGRKPSGETVVRGPVVPLGWAERQAKAQAATTGSSLDGAGSAPDPPD